LLVMSTFGFFFAVFLLVVGCFSEEDVKPNLLVFKSIPTKEVVAGKTFSVNVKIFNVGDSAAFDIHLEDNTWGSFEVISGLTEAKWDRLAVGANVSHNYSLKPNIAGLFEPKPAKVTYRLSAKGQDKKVGYSNIIPGFDVESLFSFEKRTDPHYKEWGIFAALCLLATLPAGYMWNSAASRGQAQYGKFKKY